MMGIAGQTGVSEWLAQAAQSEYAMLGANGRQSPTLVGKAGSRFSQGADMTVQIGTPSDTKPVRYVKSFGIARTSRYAA
ncbi:MAG: hypothetical protein ABI343_05895 [Burkholderiaceae bacterium]